MSRTNLVILCTLLFHISCDNAAEKVKPIHKIVRMDNLLLQTTWLYKHGYGAINFRDSVLRFVNKEYLDTLPLTVYDKFVFDTTGNVSYEVYSTKPVWFCGNGMLKITRMTWNLNRDELQLGVKGRYAMDFNFDYDITFRIDSIDEHKMLLVKVKETRANEEQSF